MTSLTAFLEETAPSSFELKFTRPLFQRPVPTVTWVSDSFDPHLLKEDDSPILRELGERLRRSGLKVAVEVRRYKICFQVLADLSAQTTRELAEMVKRVTDVAIDACWLCGAFNEVIIRSAPAC